MDYELIFWVAAAIAATIAFGVMWFLGAKEAEKYVDLEGWK